MSSLSSLNTPAALIDLPRMQRNISRMQVRMAELGGRFRPHVKTSKCLPVVLAQIDAGARGIPVSTLKEAEEFFGTRRGVRILRPCHGQRGGLHTARCSA